MRSFIRDLPWVELIAAFCLHAYHHAFTINSIWDLLCNMNSWHSALFLPSVTTGFFFFSLLPRCRFSRIFLNRDGVEHSPESSKDRTEPRPLLFPCQTTHTRLFPEKHSFSYPYLLVGVPVGRRGGANSFLSADLQSGNVDEAHKSKAWFHVSARDHLERGEHVDGLRGKLDDFLQAQVRIVLTIPKITLRGPSNKIHLITRLHILSQHLLFSGIHSTLSRSGTFMTFVMN